ncbi:MAG: M28 family peptidase [Dokdonia sp.]|nr:peptidase M28 [Cytophagaceae bacterium]
MTRIIHFFSFLLILACAYLSFSSLLPHNTPNTEVSTSEFSVDRAMQQLKIIANQPHYVGSEGHTKVRDYIMEELRDLGLQPFVQEGFVQDQWNGQGTLVKAKNILARYPGSDPTKAVLIMSHYDSAPHSKSYGASDAGSGVVTVLESFRAYLASGARPKNDIIILFTDSEELGLDGASLFVNEHPWAKDVGVAFNFEARGSSGPSNMIVETNGGNARLIEEFSKANPEYPVATSLMYSIYKMLPNDTDSTVLREDGDIDGFFFAFIDDHFNYHTANDTWQNLDPKTLAHQGSYLMPMLNHFTQIDLSSLKTDVDHVYFDTALFSFVHYPFSWVWPMAILALILFIGLLVYGFKKGQLKTRAIGLGFVAFIVSLLGSLFLLQLLGWLWPVIYPQYADVLPVFIYNGHWYTAAFVAMATAFSFGIYHHLTKPKDAASMMVAPLFFWIVINGVVAAKLAGAGFFVIPTFFALLALFVMIRQQNPSIFLLVFLSAPALLLFAPNLQFFPVGLGPAAYWITVVFTVLLFGLLLPVFGYYRNKKIVGYFGVLLTFIFLIVAHTKSEYSPERQKPNSLVYYQYTDDNQAYWVTYDKQLDPWVANYLGEEPENASLYVRSAHGSKYNAPYTYAKKAKFIDLPKAVISKSTDTIIDGLREVRLVVKPQRSVNRIRLYADEDIPFKYLEYNSQVLKFDSTDTQYKRRRSRGLISYYLAENDSLEIRYKVPENSYPKFTLVEYSFDLLEHPKFEIDKRPDYTMPKPFVSNDAIITEQIIDERAIGIDGKQQDDTQTLTQQTLEE